MQNAVDPSHQDLFAKLSKIFQFNVTDILQVVEVMDGLQISVLNLYPHFSKLNNWQFLNHMRYLVKLCILHIDVTLGTADSTGTDFLENFGTGTAELPQTKNHYPNLTGTTEQVPQNRYRYR